MYMAYVIYNSGIGHKPIANVLHIPRNYQNDLNDLICVYLLGYEGVS